MTDTADRIRKLRGTKSQAEFAELVGVSRNTVVAYEAGNRTPSGSALKKMNSAFGVSADWVLFGKDEEIIQVAGAKQHADAVTHVTGAQPPAPWWPSKVDEVAEQPADLCTQIKAADAGEELVMVPKVRARLSAGTGSLEASSEVLGRYAFRSPWLRSKGRTDSMVLMEVTGDSMEPELREGDTVLLDQSQNDVLSGKIYAVGIDEEVIVKYIDKAIGGYSFRSANKDYPPLTANLSDESLNIRILGRVLWWCREAR